ncbi:MAG TPA: hypothetical protein VGS07_20510 [Thermoanaerobaculia bacterium]|nr:hypothetical protein [Thermoanaerobaculia bacterium]
MDSEPESSGATRKPLPFSREKRGLPRWLPIAALLVVGVGAGGTYLELLAPLPALLTRDVTESVPTSQDQNLWRGPTTRGPGSEEEVKLQEASFKMGVQLVNLQMSLKAGRAEDAQDVVARILGLLGSQSFTKDLEDGYTKITTSLANGRKPADLLSEASWLAGLSRDVFESSSLDLGQWVEAGRLASVSYDPTFFRMPKGRSFLRRSLWRDRLGIESLELPKAKESRPELDAVYKIADQGTFQPVDFVNLQGHFKKILELNYPE